MNERQDDLERAFEIADLYVRSGHNQSEVARRLGVSRRRVSQLIDVARAAGIYRESVVPPRAEMELLALGRDLRTRFGLKHAVVVPGRKELMTPGPRESHALEDTRRAVFLTAAQAAAQYLDASLRGSDVLCVAWGQTVHAVIQFVQALHFVQPASRDPRPDRRLPNLTVVPMLGILSEQPDAVESNALAAEMAAAFGSRRYYCLPVPAIVRDEAQKRAALQLPMVHNVMSRIRKASFVVTSVGAPDPRGSTLVTRGLLTAEEISQIEGKAIGEVCAWWFDADGVPVRHPRVEPIGLGIEGLASIVRSGGTVLAVAAADSVRIPPLLAAMRGRLVNVVVTDSESARALLEPPRGQGSSR